MINEVDEQEYKLTHKKKMFSFANPPFLSFSNNVLETLHHKRKKNAKRSRYLTLIFDCKLVHVRRRTTAEKALDLTFTCGAVFSQDHKVTTAIFV